jgi:hypothetical protein
MTYISDTIIKKFAKKIRTLPEDPFGSVMGFVRVIHWCSTEIPPLTNSWSPAQRSHVSVCYVRMKMTASQHTQLNEKWNNINISSHNKPPPPQKKPCINTKPFYDQPCIFLLHRISAVVFNLMCAHVALYKLILWYLSIFQKILYNQCFKWYAQICVFKRCVPYDLFFNTYTKVYAQNVYMTCVPNVMSCSILNVTL